MKKLLQKIFFTSFNSYHATIITAEVLLGIGLCLLSLIFFVSFSREIADADFTFIDRTISMFVYSLRTPALTQFMLLISSFGESLCLVLAALVAIVFLVKQHRKEAVLFCLVLIMGFLLNTSLKTMFHRARPNIAPLVIEQSYSFPSGHAMNSFIFYALMAYFSYHFFRHKGLTIVLSLGAIALVLLIGFSRIYLGVHYFTDVLAGYLAGFWWFITVLLIEHTLVFYKLYKKSE